MSAAPSPVRGTPQERSLLGPVRAAALVAISICLAILLGGLLYHELLWTPVNPEDCEWIQGVNFGHSNRVIQWLLLHEIYPRYFAGSFEPLYILAVSVHVVSSLLIYWLFYLLVGTVKTAYPRGVAARHLGGIMAGALFLSYHSVSHVYLAALSYQLATLFTLLTLIFALIYLRDRRPLFWLLVMIGFTLALFSHSYALGLPLLVGALELVHRRCAPGRPPARRWYLRYGLLLALLGLHVAQFFSTFLGRSTAMGAQLMEPIKELLRFGLYLQVITLDMVKNVRIEPIIGYVQYGPPIPELPDHLPLILAALGVLAAAGCLAIYRRRPLGISASFLVFVVLWNGLTFVVTRRGPGYEQDLWRYIFNVAGLCLFVPFCAISLLELITARFARRWTSLAAWLIFLPLLALTGPKIWQRAANLHSDFSLGTTKPRSRFNCANPTGCSGRRVLSRQEVREAAAARRSLACTDLSNLDLSGLDLRGVDLAGARLCRARLDKTRLDGARLTGACMHWSVWRDVSATGADLGGASLVGADMKDVDLGTAHHRGLIAHCRLAQRVKWPAGWKGR